MTQATVVLMLSVVVTQNIPQGRLVTPLGVVSNDSLAAMGITCCDGEIGDCVSVAVLGTAAAEAAEAIAVGDKLTPDADGKMRVAVPNDPVYAIALQSASAAGQLIEILIK